MAHLTCCDEANTTFTIKEVHTISVENKQF